jgi:DNA-binding response OmpR family regulator
VALASKVILVVDDEPKIAEAAEAYLRAAGYTIASARDGREALRIFNGIHPDMVVLDLMLPYLSGEQVCAEIRKNSMAPIIMLTAKAREDDVIGGLALGADDYMTKPFSPRELVARVKSLFRRADDGVSPAFSRISWNSGSLAADFDARTVSVSGRSAGLTPSEFKLFAALAARPHKTFTRDELIEIAFGQEFDGFDRTIDSHIKNLRAKIETGSGEPVYVLTVRGVGYRFGGARDGQYTGYSK